VLAFDRLSRDGSRHLVCIANLSPVPREGYRVGLPLPGDWTEALNTDSAFYGGSGVGNMGAVQAEEQPWHDQPYSARVTVPPLGVVWLRPRDA
jgi:1,4-alpha-glucan branching enzyme